ncbi:MAG TPA: molybdenum cofactor guanylyltransferase [Acidobacteriaceae bacterium]|jgi:molybdopterin-guanine dinucleotide biosynthesis protein A|nr:molybdenum cofactor guanylyltransferase [Acidobacteriaceae bacterium]
MTSIPMASGPIASDPATGFVLAGGHSTRLGQDKVLLAWHGHTLLEDALDKLRAVCCEVRICTNRLELGRYAPVIPDAADSAGPLAGITAALEVSTTAWNLFLPVDLPWMPVAFLAELLDRARSGVALAVVPYLATMPQPLCAAYHRSLLPGLQQALIEGKHKVMLALEQAASLPCGDCPGGFTTAIDRYPVDAPGHAAGNADWFLNINTPEDLAQALLKRSNYSIRR